MQTSAGRFNWHWREKGPNYYVSQPDLCWMNGTILLRKCDTSTGEWIPDTVECKTLPRKNQKCPEDLIEVRWNENYICVKMSKQPQTYSEHNCLGSDYVLTLKDLNNNKLRDLFIQSNITKFWLPVQLYEDKWYNPLVIKLAGKQWNDIYDEKDSFRLKDYITGKRCFAVFVGETNLDTEIRNVYCNDSFYSVCIYKQRLVTTSGCPYDFGALAHKPNECYGILTSHHYNAKAFHSLSIQEYYEKQNTIWTIFNKRRILIKKFLQLEANDTYAKIPAHLMWVLDREGTINVLPKRQKFPRLSTITVTKKGNNVKLKLFIKRKSLNLIVYNIYNLWSSENSYKYAIHCFSNAYNGELNRINIKKIWESDFKDRAMFKLKLRTYDPALYWCEAHTIFNFTIVTSERITAAKNSLRHTFAMKLDYQFGNETTLRSFVVNLRRYSNDIRKDLKAVCKKHGHLKTLKIHTVRIVHVELLSNDLTNVRYLCHVTISSNSHFSNNTLQTESNEIFGGHDISHVKIAKYLHELLTFLVTIWQPKMIDSIQSTEFCFFELPWLPSRLGQSGTVSVFCLQKNGLPPTRKCLGSFLQGVYWEEPPYLDSDCITKDDSNLITRKLYNIEARKNKESLESNVAYIRHLLKPNLKNLIPADLYYLAKFMKYTLDALLDPNNRERFNDNRLNIITNIITIHNDLLDAEKRVFTSVAILNSTNILLDVFESLIDEVIASTWYTIPDLSEYNRVVTIKDDSIINVTAYKDIGVIVNAASNFITFIIDPQVANITGIAIYQQEFDNITNGLLFGSFSNEYFRFITTNQNIEDLFNEWNLMIAAYMPESLWQRLDEIAYSDNRTDTPNAVTKIVIKIYANDKLFQEGYKLVNKVGGRVISISIPGHDEHLPEMLPIIFKLPDQTNDSENMAENRSFNKHKCSYWNYREWSMDGVTFMGESSISNCTVLCASTHLTPFAYLIGTHYKMSDEFEVHEKALDLITILGCCLSLLGIAGLFTTACIFRSWRKKANSIVLLQLSTATALEMILLCFVNTKYNIYRLTLNGIYTSCIAIGAALHYFVLVQFSWMIIIAYLQFKRYVQVFGNTRPKRFFIKSTLLGWGLPLIPVLLCLVVDKASYIPYDSDAGNSVCYPTGRSLYFGIFLPISGVVLTNLIIFIIIVYNIMRNPTGSTRHLHRSVVLSQLRLYVLLFFLLGFTWIFGFMAATNVGLVFSYLFCLTATLQGFVLFIYFIIMDPTTRHMWWKYLSILCGLKTYPDGSRTTTQSFTG